MDIYNIMELMWGVLSLFLSVLLALCAYDKSVELYHCIKGKVRSND